MAALLPHELLEVAADILLCGGEVILATTPANEHDETVTGQLLHGGVKRYGVMRP